MAKFIRLESAGKTHIINISTISEILPRENKIQKTDGSVIYLDSCGMFNLIKFIEADIINGMDMSNDTNTEKAQLTSIQSGNY